MGSRSTSFGKWSPGRLSPLDSDNNSRFSKTNFQFSFFQKFLLFRQVALFPPKFLFGSTSSIDSHIPPIRTLPTPPLNILPTPPTYTSRSTPTPPFYISRRTLPRYTSRSTPIPPSYTSRSAPIPPSYTSRSTPTLSFDASRSTPTPPS